MRKNTIEKYLKRKSTKIIHIPSYDSFGTTVQIRPYLYGILAKSPLYSSDAWVYLLIGEKKALVIDTGFGIGDLRSVLVHLSGEKELIVFNTHFHIDHTLGNLQFEKVHISSRDAEMLFHMDFNEYSRISKRKVTDHSFYKEEDVLPYAKYQVVPVDENWKVDLGNCELEAFYVPGHSSGEMVLLDRTHRLLFTGDTVLYPFPAPMAFCPYENPLYPELMTVKEFAKGLEKIVTHKDEFDFICDGHGVPLGPGQIVEDMLYCANTVIEAPDEDYVELEMARGSARQKYWGLASVIYVPERVK